MFAGKTRFKNSSKYCNKTRITRITTNNDVDVVLMFLLLTLNMFHTFFSTVSIVDFQRVNVSWVLDYMWVFFVQCVKNLSEKFKADLLTVCSYHVTYVLKSESTLYSCLNVKELLARNRREI